MKRIHEGHKRQFVQVSRAWYASANLPHGDDIDIVTVGFYCPDGGTSGEFQIGWEYLGGDLTPRLCAYDDGWDALFHFSDMLEAMAKADNENITPDAFCAMLRRLGIEDATPTQR